MKQCENNHDKSATALPGVDDVTGQAADLHRAVREARSRSTTGKALFHLRFRKLPMAPGMRCRTGIPTPQYSHQKTNDRGENYHEGDWGNGPGCAAGTAGMKLVERPEPQAAIND